MPPFVLTHAREKMGDIESQDEHGLDIFHSKERQQKSMRTYDIYRHQDLTARMRVLDSGQIEWAYEQETVNWQGFWWSNDVKLLIEELAQDFPHRKELAVSEFTVRRCEKQRYSRVAKEVAKGKGHLSCR
jgi:hypothetical protein